MTLKIVLPSDVGTTIKAELKTSNVIQATTNKRTIRSTKLYLLKDSDKNDGKKSRIS